MSPRFPWLGVLRFTFGSAFAYTSYMLINVLMIVLKLIYVFFLVIFLHLNTVFTGIVSFLKVNFFGI
jgi:hypothetical protein